MKRIAVIAILFAAVPAIAQQAAPDPAFLQKALSAVADQRNQALNNLAVVQAQLDQMREESAALKKQIEDLKPKDAPKN